MTFWHDAERMKRFDAEMIAISSAVALCSRTSSSPSSFSAEMTELGAPWKSGHGVNSTVARCRLRSLHPLRTRMAMISHRVARDSDSVAMLSLALSDKNCTRLRSRQNTVVSFSSTQTLWEHGAQEDAGAQRGAQRENSDSPTLGFCRAMYLSVSGRMMVYVESGAISWSYVNGVSVVSYRLAQYQLWGLTDVGDDVDANLVHKRVHGHLAVSLLPAAGRLARTIVCGALILSTVVRSCRYCQRSTFPPSSITCRPQLSAIRRERVRAASHPSAASATYLGEVDVGAEQSRRFGGLAVVEVVMPIPSPQVGHRGRRKALAGAGGGASLDVEDGRGTTVEG